MHLPSATSSAYRLVCPDWGATSLTHFSKGMAGIASLHAPHDPPLWRYCGVALWTWLSWATNSRKNPLARGCTCAATPWSPLRCLSPSSLGSTPLPRGGARFMGTTLSPVIGIEYYGNTRKPRCLGAWARHPPSKEGRRRHVKSTGLPLTVCGKPRAGSINVFQWLRHFTCLQMVHAGVSVVFGPSSSEQRLRNLQNLCTRPPAKGTPLVTEHRGPDDGSKTQF